MVFTSIVTEESTSLRLKTKFELPHAEVSTGRLEPIQHGPNSKADFGALVYGIDLNNFTDADFNFIHNALHRHKLLVFKEQPQMLTPQQQFRLTSRYGKCFDVVKTIQLTVTP
jgi:alpha-ketoglutarate-dependent taurine dioxygenase